MVKNFSTNDPAYALIELATSHHQHGRFEQAFEVFFQAAELYRMQEQSELAAQTFRKLLRLETSDIELQFALVKNFLELNLIAEAADAFCLFASHFDTLGVLDRFLTLANQLLSIDPDLTEVRNKVIDVLLRDTEIYLSYRLFDKAKIALERALATFPNSVRIHEMMLSLIRQNDEQDKSEQLPWLLRLAELTRNDRKTSCQYLSCALTVAEDPAEVYQFAHTIGVDFQCASQSASRDSEITLDESLDASQTLDIPHVAIEEPEPAAEKPVDAVEQPAEQQTTPAEPNSTSRPALSLRERLALRLKPAPQTSQHELVLLHTLLQTVENCQDPTTLNIFAPQTASGPHAELLAIDGCLSLTMRLNGEPLPGPPLQTTDNPAEPRALATTALLQIARAFAGIPFEIQPIAAKQEVSRTGLLAPLSLLIALTNSFAENSETSAAAQFFQATSALADSGWLFMDTPPGGVMPLPIANLDNTKISLESLTIFANALEERKTFLQKLFPGEKYKRPLLTHLIALDCGYACFSAQGYIALVQLEKKNTGKILHIARQFIGNQEQETPAYASV